MIKLRHKFAAALAALFLTANIFPIFMVKAGTLPEGTQTAAGSGLTPDQALLEKWAVVTPEEADSPSQAAAPMFQARIEYSPQGYRVRGTFTELPPDAVRIQTLCSLDGESYPFQGQDWYLNFPEPEDESTLAYFQTQTCLFSNNEPLKSYLEGKLNSFYLKLRLTKKDGVTYETQAAAIVRGEPQPVPEGITPIAKFPSNMTARDPGSFKRYGIYQLTVSEDATPEEISAWLPDTLPIEVQILPKEIGSAAIGTVNCPITWKPLALPKLTAGENIVVPDAAETVEVPSGTMLNTPMGVFQLDEPLGIHQYALTDEIRLSFNVIGKGEAPTGALVCENDGLKMSFHLKPTGASAIRAYTLPQGGTIWEELPGLSLLYAVNAQPSTANSGHAYVLGNSCEPYRSYLAAQAAGNEPTPFFIGLKIEGGVYGGQQLILAWPDTYEVPPNLPNLGGSGGNEGNAGADNKADSTEGGQRPNLPQNPESSLPGHNSGSGDSNGNGTAQPPGHNSGSGDSNGNGTAQPPGHNSGSGDSNGDGTAQPPEHNSGAGDGNLRQAEDSLEIKPPNLPWEPVSITGWLPEISWQPVSTTDTLTNSNLEQPQQNQTGSAGLGKADAQPPAMGTAGEVPSHAAIDTLDGSQATPAPPKEPLPTGQAPTPPPNTTEAIGSNRNGTEETSFFLFLAAAIAAIYIVKRYLAAAARPSR